MPFLLVDTRFHELPEIEALTDAEFRDLFTRCLNMLRSFRDARTGESVDVDLDIQWLIDEGLIKIRQTRRAKWDRAKLWQQFNGVCYLCREPVGQEEFHIEHVKPLSRGGGDVWSNLNIAHASCNLRKGARLVEELA